MYISNGAYSIFYLGSRVGTGSGQPMAGGGQQSESGQRPAE